jgi:hypothetical protein
MNRLLTPEKLVLFVYDEIRDPEERSSMGKAIRSKSDWLQMYTELKEARQMLDHNHISPSDNVIKRIMDYSASLGTPPGITPKPGK